MTIPEDSWTGCELPRGCYGLLFVVSCSDNLTAKRMKNPKTSNCLNWSTMGQLCQENIIIILLSLSLAINCVRGSSDPIFAYGNATPFPDAIKCYTCEDKSNNQECNRKAYDFFCAEGTKYCYTRHHLNHETGESFKVTKKCAIKDICSPHVVGCTMTGVENTKVCISCCEGSLCNIDVPVNESTAIFTMITPYNSGMRYTGNLYLILLPLLLIAYVFRIL